MEIADIDTVSLKCQNLEIHISHDFEKSVDPDKNVCNFNIQTKLFDSV